jgi:hypothetical protein
VVLPIMSVNNATRGYLKTQTSFFQTLAVRATPSNNNPVGSVYADDTFNGILFVFNNVTGNQTQNYSGVANSPAFTTTGSTVALGPGGLSVIQFNPGTTPNDVYNISTLTFSAPYFIALGPGGSPAYVSSEAGGPVAVMNSQGQITSYIGGGGLLKYPQALATDASGNLYVIDGLTNVVYKFSSSGSLLLNFSMPYPEPQAEIGQGICIDPNNGNIVVPADNDTASAGTGYVLVFSPSGTLLNVVGQSIVYPFSCAVTSSSTVIVVGSNEPATINFINPTSGSMTTVTDTNLASGTELYGMAISPDGRIFVGALNFAIYVLNSAGSYLGTVSAPAEDIYTYSLAYTSTNNGTLYCVDIFNDRIVTFPSINLGPVQQPSSSAAHPTTTGSAAFSAVFAAIVLIVCTLFSTA